MKKEIKISGSIKIHKSLVKTGLDQYTYKKPTRNFEFKLVKSWQVINDYIYLPRNMNKFTSIFGSDFSIVDDRKEVMLRDDASLNADFKLRDYQVKPIHNILDSFSSGDTDILFNGNTAFGKTATIPYIITKIKQKTIIFTDRTDLNKQMLLSINKFSNLKVALLTKTTKVSEYDVIITTLQYVNRNFLQLFSMRDEFGLCITDEVHVIGAESYLKAINTINSKYRLGLSATPTRSDGLTSILTDTLSVCISGENPDKLLADIEIINTDIVCSNTSNENSYINIVRNCISSSKIMNMVCAKISELVSQDRNIFLVINTQEAQISYKKYLESMSINCVVVNSTTKNRQDIFDSIGKSINVLIGFGTLEKGVDVPVLDTLVHVAGISTTEKLEQSIGRITRIYRDKKSPLVVDYMFEGIMYKSCRARSRFYKQFKQQDKVKSIKVIDLD